ncbi:MAG: TIGR01458 family HAD-type hydrolase [Gemmatimonadales bacterium]|jgi:HAD superfamily hydrolase (TIGR01458 family)
MPKRPSGLLIDLDGTVWDGDALIPGADEALATLRAAGMPFRFVTNMTRVPRGTIAEWLARAGIVADAAEIFTPPLAAAAWLKGRGLERVLLCLAPQAVSEFGGFVVDEEAPQAVVVGDMGEAWTIGIMNRAFRSLLAGAEFLALHKNRYWKTPNGLCLDAGAFVAALEYATGRAATVVGKPSRALFEAAAQSMGLRREDVAMVGDSLSSDIAGAKSAGSLGILVRTGKFSPDEVSRSSVKPDAIIDSLAAVPGLVLARG